MYFKIDEAVTLKRTSAATWLTAHGGAVPSLPPRLPLKPTRKELAVIIALAETYGAVLYTDARYVVVLDFVADHGAVELVQRVMWGPGPRPISMSPPLPRKTRCSPTPCAATGSLF